MQELVGWTGVILGFIARWLMAYHRRQAVIVILISTLLLLVWACTIRDWQSMVLRVLAIGFQVRTLRAWAREN
jgi:hypothetical protein